MSLRPQSPFVLDLRKYPSGLSSAGQPTSKKRPQQQLLQIPPFVASPTATIPVRSPGRQQSHSPSVRVQLVHPDDAVPISSNAHAPANFAGYFPSSSLSALDTTVEQRLRQLLADCQNARWRILGPSIPAMPQRAVSPPRPSSTFESLTHVRHELPSAAAAISPSRPIVLKEQQEKQPQQEQPIGLRPKISPVQQPKMISSELRLIQEDLANYQTELHALEDEFNKADVVQWTPKQKDRMARLRDLLLSEIQRCRSRVALLLDAEGAVGSSDAAREVAP